MASGRISLIIGGEGGGHGLLGTLRGRLPAKRWRVPAGDDPATQIRFLIDNPPPKGMDGEVYTDVQGDWMRVRGVGWRIVWCGNSRAPVGTVQLDEERLYQSVGEFSAEVWGMTVPDMRMVGDVMLGRTSDVGVVLYVTSATGGVGKTTGSRRLCERAAQHGVRPLLVDGNMGQGSQRSFFDPGGSKALNSVANWRPGMDTRAGANRGETLGVRYDLACAPTPGTVITWDAYRQYIREARKLWPFVVVDLDRISAKDLRDRTTAAGSLVVPALRSHDPCLFIVKAGAQTQGDALGVLKMLASRAMNVPRECVGIKDVMPPGMDSYKRSDYRQYGTWLGCERQTAEAGMRIASGASNWADPGLDETRERVLAWALPGRGFDPGRFGDKDDGKRKGKPTKAKSTKDRPVKRGWFGR